MEIQLVQFVELVKLARGLPHSKLAFIIDPSLDLEETAVGGMNDPRILEKLIADGKLHFVHLDIDMASSHDEDPRFLAVKDLAMDAWMHYISIDGTIFVKIVDDDATYTSLG